MLTIHFIVPSALNTTAGVFSNSERELQTQETFNSIKHFNPNSNITILETSKQPLTINQKEFISKNSVNLFDLTKDPYVVHVYNKYMLPDFIGVIKNLLETYAVSMYLSTATFEENTTFIAKIGGRYKLSKKFIFDAIPNKISLPYPTIETNKEAIWAAGMDYQYPGYFYAWDISLKQQVLDLYNKMHNEMVHELKFSRSPDLEHLMYKFCLKDLIHHSDNFKVEGCIASNGIKVEQ